jgi:lipopolysaccharide transport system permease protein
MNPSMSTAASDTQNSPGEHVLVLEAGRAERHYWRDIWHYRELFAILAWRDVSVRYKQTALGVAWALLRPFITMMVLTIVFGRMAKLPGVPGTPYAILVFSGMLPWFLFSTVLSEGSDSLIANANLVGKVYFPRIIIPSATAILALVDMTINLGMLAALMAWYGFLPTWRILLLPIFVALTILASLGPTLLMAALNVKYRDFRYIVPFVVQFGIYISPVGFSSKIVPEQWRYVYDLNPVVGAIYGFRWCILGGHGNSPLYMSDFLVSCGSVVFLLWLGISYFRATERGFADFI